MAENYSLLYEGEEIDALLQKIEELDDATASKSGLMSQTDKTKLDGIATGAQVNVIESIAVGDEDVQISNKKARIVPDSAPTQDSTRLATSGGIFTAINNVITALANYYLKTETYSKSEVNALVAAIKQFSYQVAETLPTASEDTMYIVYLVPSGNPEEQNVKDEFITVRSGEEGSYTYSWEQIGSTAVDLSGYSTTEEMNAAIATALQAYTTTEALTELLAKKANTDGWYGGMTVGSAENLVGRGSVEAEYGGIRTSAGSADIGSGSASIVRMKGNSFKWNQLKIIGGDLSKTENGVTVIDNRDGSYLVSTDANGATGDVTVSFISIGIIGEHKYLIKGCPLGGSTTTFRIELTAAYFNTPRYDYGGGIITTAMTSIGSLSLPRIKVFSGAIITTPVVFKPQLIDLTAIFGSGNEPSTVEEFDTWREEMGLTLDYYEYNEGEVINNRAQAIETIGFNRYDPETGKAYLPGKYSDYPQEYEICGTFTSISFKDINGNESVPILTDGRFFNVDAPGELTVVGGNATDTLVHLVWSGWRNQGEPDYAYEAYWKNRLNVGLTTLKGKLNGAGESVVIFPNGAAKIGDTQDEIIGNKAIKRIASRAYTSGDESDASVLTDGHELTYYVPATPEEYILDETPGWNYRVDDFGTEQAIPSYSASELTAPISYDVQYAMNAVDAIRRLDTNYVRRDNVKQTAGRSETDVLSQKAVDDNYAKKVGVENDLVVGAAKTLAGNQRQVKEFSTMVMDGADGIAKINEVRGKSLVWNQMVQNGNFSNGTTGWDVRAGTSSVVDGIITLNTPYNTLLMSTTIYGITGHKYLGFAYLRATSSQVYFRIGSTNVYHSGSGNFERLAAFHTKSVSNVNPQFRDVRASDYDDVQVKNVILIDLTLMFGAGNEPSTVEEFEALFPLPYYEYNAGEIISNKTEKLGVTGFNQWDEEWEEGTLTDAEGSPQSSNTTIRSKNYCHCFSGSVYGVTHTVRVDICWYDAGKNFISKSKNVQTTITAPSGAAYFKIIITSTTYNHDICINISDPAKNGTYEPYKHADLPMNLSTITGKLNGEGDSVTIFPNGMRSAGTAHDYLIVDEDGYARKAVKVIEKVDLGMLDWSVVTLKDDTTAFSTHNQIIDGYTATRGPAAGLICSKYDCWRTIIGDDTNIGDKLLWQRYAQNVLRIYIHDSAYTDAATFKTAMSGVELIYELAEPLTYDLDEPIPMTFMAYHGGTIMQTPQAPESAPMVANMTFAIDAVSTLNDLPEDYISAASIDNFLSVLSSQMDGTWARTFNATTGKHEFTFTPSSNTNESGL